MTISFNTSDSENFYILGDYLGQGSTSSVYATASCRKSPLAIKFLDSDSYQRGISEACILKILQNAPYTIQYRSSFDFEETLEKPKNSDRKTRSYSILPEADSLIKGQNLLKKSKSASEFFFDEDQEEELSVIHPIKRDPTQKINYAIVTSALSAPTLFDVYLKEITDKSPTKLFAKEILNIGNQALEAIFFYHSKNIIHTDIKPDNLSYDEITGNLTILDFGHATLEVPTKPEKLMQSRWYRAPEKLLFMDYNYEIDLWSLGCTLFELYTGTPLFTSKGNDLTSSGEINYTAVNNQLHAIAKELGLPPQKWIEQLKTDKKNYFFAEKEPYQLIHAPSKGTFFFNKTWKERLEIAAQTKSEDVSAPSFSKLKALIENLIRYEGRTHRLQEIFEREEF